MDVRKAAMQDVREVMALVRSYPDRLLPRSGEEISVSIRDFWVAVDGTEMVGCVALKIYGDDLAEVRTLAVAPARRGQGIGRLLLEASEGEARRLGVRTLFALTYEAAFFEKAGFARAEKGNLPHKIWEDCVNCPKFPDCDETAVVKALSAE
jgi:amino-acid N-acetyltransferase